MPFNHAQFEKGQCATCGLSFKGRNGLGRHIHWFHKMTLNEYFLMHGGENVLCKCGNQSNWLFSQMRYSGYCSRSCAMKEIRKDDSDSYRENISRAMKGVWAKRPRSEQCILRHLQAENARKKVIHSDEWILPEGVDENLSNFFNMQNGNLRTIHTT